MSATCLQLTIEGDEVVHPLPRLRALTQAQREILRLIGYQGQIRPVRAGIIIHSHREHPCPPSQGERGCCQYASSDGWDVLNRLRKRGIVEPVGDGSWRVAG